MKRKVNGLGELEIYSPAGAWSPWRFNTVRFMSSSGHGSTEITPECHGDRVTVGECFETIMDVSPLSTRFGG